MPCRTLYDPKTGEPIGMVCSRGSGPEPELLKQRFRCRRWVKCKECQDYSSCKEIAGKLGSKKEAE